MRERELSPLFPRVADFARARRSESLAPGHSCYVNKCYVKNALTPPSWLRVQRPREHSRGGGGGHSLIWPIRRRAAGQGMVFGLLCPEQGIQFYANLS